MTRARTSLAALSLTAVVAAPIAVAATPENGSVSTASPKVEWSGESGGYGITAANILVHAGGEQMVCEAPFCDTFTLDVADAGHTLTIAVTSENSSITQLEVEKPDGSWVYEYGIEAEGEEPDHTTQIKISKAPKGTYVVRSMSNAAGPADPYTAYAALAVPSAAPVPATGTSPTAPPASGPAPAPAAAPKLSVKVGKASAKKLNRKRALVATVSSDQAVTDVKAFFKKGKKVIATGSLAALSGRGKVKLKLSRKLKPGKYVLAVTARSASGGTVGASTKVAVKR